MTNYLQIKKINNDEITLILSHFNHDQLIYTIYLNSAKRKIGYCDLRTAHSAEMNYYGNIGYRINEKYRGNNYAYKASVLLIKIAKMINMDYLLITCSPENIASEKTIQKLQARYIATVEVPRWHPLYFSERTKKIYRLDL
ncbi:MAG: GNAT family N-acetyltransferase [Erysipelotrichia bacterium]|nr:GNAT family N-acetyltransferase [Erysipelotrichia bacterium]